MRVAAYVGGLIGLALLITLVVRADFAAILLTLGAAGWALLWLAPYRLLFFALYALGWQSLLRPYDPRQRAGPGYLLWVTTVREAVDRLLPVASLGGGVVAVRLLHWRGLEAPAVGATVIVEVVLTLIAVYLFTAVGLVLLVDLSAAGHEVRRVLVALVVALPVPAAILLLLRYGSVFERLHGLLRPLIGEGTMALGAASLDRELRASLRRGGRLIWAGALQFAALVSGGFEVWFALHLFGHPIGAGAALVLESMTQAMRHVAFVVPAGIGVQEAGLVLFGHALGVDGELALSVSMAKRMREVVCGLPPLISWQWLEGRRLRARRSNSA